MSNENEGYSGLNTWQSALGNVRMLHASAPHTSAALRLMADLLDLNEVEQGAAGEGVAAVSFLYDDGACVSVVLERGAA